MREPITIKTNKWIYKIEIQGDSVVINKLDRKVWEKKKRAVDKLLKNAGMKK